MEIQAIIPSRLELEQTTSWDHSYARVTSNEKAHNTVCVLQMVCPNYQIIQILKIFKGYHGKENYLPSCTNKLSADQLKHED